MVSEIEVLYEEVLTGNPAVFANAIDASFSAETCNRLHSRGSGIQRSVRRVTEIAFTARFNPWFCSSKLRFNVSTAVFSAVDMTV